jgi:hypothetical protein
MDETPIPLSGTASAWIEFAIMAGAFLLVAAGSLLWLFYFRKRPRQRKHRHHHHRRHRRRSSPVTPAQAGGLPPVRREPAPLEPPSPTAQP